MERPARARKLRGVDFDERRAIRHDAFIEAGLEVFGTVGFRDATVSMICAVADYTKRYFYESFDNREDLLIAVHIEAVTRQQAHVEKALDRNDMPPVELLSHAVRAVFDGLDRDRRLARVLYIEVLGVSDAVDRRHIASTHEWVSSVASIIEDRTRARPEESTAIATTVVSSIVGAALWWACTDYESPCDQVSDGLVDMFSGRIANLL